MRILPPLFFVGVPLSVILILVYFNIVKPKLRKWIITNGVCVNAKIIKVENAYKEDILIKYKKEKGVSNNFNTRKFCEQNMESKRTRGQDFAVGYSAVIICDFGGKIFEELVVLIDHIEQLLEENIEYLAVYYHPKHPRLYTFSLDEFK